MSYFATVQQQSIFHHSTEVNSHIFTEIITGQFRLSLSVHVYVDKKVCANAYHLSTLIAASFAGRLDLSLR